MLSKKQGQKLIFGSNNFVVFGLTCLLAYHVLSSLRHFPLMERGFHDIVQASQKVVTILPDPLECWDYRHPPPYWAHSGYLNPTRTRSTCFIRQLTKLGAACKFSSFLKWHLLGGGDGRCTVATTVLFHHHVGSKSWTQSKHLHPLSQPSGSMRV